MSYKNPRIQLNDTFLDVVTKMSEGYPGAVNVLCIMHKFGASVDPDDFLGGYGAILALDTLDIYGGKIYLFYNDLCKRNLPEMIALLRAVQLGYMSEGTLKTAINESQIAPVVYNDILAKVKEHLPKFNFTPIGELP